MKLFNYLVITTSLLFLIGGCAAKLQNTDMDKEKVAILEVIAKETETYYKQDFEGWKSTYVKEPYFRLFGYWEGFDHKVRFHNGFNSLEEEKKEQFEQGTTIWLGSRVERFNENIRVYPEAAWITFEEHTYEISTGKLRGKSLQTRILEKQDGAWKIAYLGYHFFPNNTIQN